MIATNYHYLIIIIAYVIRKKLFQFLSPLNLHPDKMICVNSLNFEKIAEKARYFCEVNYLAQWVQKINCHACLSDITTQKKRIILFLRTSHVY